jgi:HEAT repeat protein
LMIDDDDVEVRRVVASRIAPQALKRLTADVDPLVRYEAAQRLEPAQLPDLIADPDWRVRYEVARRAELDQIAPLLSDEDPIVRETAESRMRDAAEKSRGAVIFDCNSSSSRSGYDQYQP